MPSETRQRTDAIMARVTAAMRTTQAESQRLAALERSLRQLDSQAAALTAKGHPIPPQLEEARQHCTAECVALQTRLDDAQAVVQAGESELAAIQAALKIRPGKEA